MKRAAWLQDRRMQKFRDVLSRWEGGDLSKSPPPSSRPPRRRLTFGASAYDFSRLRSAGGYSEFLVTAIAHRLSRFVLPGLDMLDQHQPGFLFVIGNLSWERECCGLA
jgi:hypothetical protein